MKQSNGLLGSNQLFPEPAKRLKRATDWLKRSAGVEPSPELIKLVTRMIEHDSAKLLLEKLRSGIIAESHERNIVIELPPEPSKINYRTALDYATELILPFVNAE